jgi:hypothetical protein
MIWTVFSAVLCSVLFYDTVLFHVTGFLLCIVLRLSCIVLFLLVMYVLLP